MVLSSPAAASPSAAASTDVGQDRDCPNPSPQPPRLMFVASDPTHLARLLSLRSWWDHRNRTWVAIDEPAARTGLAGEHVIWVAPRTAGQRRGRLRGARLAARAIRTERPDAVIAAGSGVALPFVLIARLRGIPIVEVEVHHGTDGHRVSDRLCRRLANQFLVQWPEPTDLYPSSSATA